MVLPIPGWFEGHVCPVGAALARLSSGDARRCFPVINMALLLRPCVRLKLFDFKHDLTIVAAGADCFFYAVHGHDQVGALRGLDGSAFGNR